MSMINLSPSKTEQAIKSKLEEIALLHGCSSRKVKYDLLAYLLLGVKSEVSNTLTEHTTLGRLQLSEKAARLYRRDVRLAAASGELADSDEFTQALTSLVTSCD